MSTRLWRQLTTAIINKDMEAATDAKLAVEEAQRTQRRRMDESGERHAPRFFALQDGRWVPKLEYVFSSISDGKLDSVSMHSVPDDPQEATSAVKEWIFGVSPAS